ncbi:MAG: methionine--tRNA ligase [Deltaproteobacteria bacterium]|nr:methionine--tRNA ligase [Deltaproteobacteria bacterium]
MAKNLVTPALPYANGAIHLGHLVEHVQVNIFARALRMFDEDVLYVCGADSHGTPIELNAIKAGKDPAVFVEEWRKSHEDSFKKFSIEFDGGYGSTHTDGNKKHAARIYQALKDDGVIYKKDVRQLYDPDAKRFLADRMVKGTCPKCKAEEQWGDSCDVCSSAYSAKEMINPVSSLTGASLVEKDSEHVFVKLEKYEAFLKKWTAEGAVPDEVQNFLKGWFEGGLRDWDISRDGPYFGFEIPGEDDKYFYVWLDAPIGYQSLCEKAAIDRGETFEDYWKDSDTKIYHFIGKDIIYFHTLFWPAMLHAAKDTLPTLVPVHGMLTVDSVKMSKSKGTFINADHFYECVGDLGADALRYYYACKLSGGIEDLDFSIEDFTNRVNADLVNKIVNLVSRTIPQLHKHNDGKLADYYDSDEARALVAIVTKEAATIPDDFRSLNYASATRRIVGLAEHGNKYLQEQTPWTVAKEDPAKAARMLSTALWVGKVCIALLKPVLPRLSAGLEEILDVKDGFSFQNFLESFEDGKSIQPYTHLFKRLQAADVAKVIAPSGEVEASKKTAKKGSSDSKRPSGKSAKKTATDKADDGECTFDDFMKVDLRAARVIKAVDVEGADKLISITLDMGDLGERHVFSGLKPHVKPADLDGKMMVLVANLKPRKMKFGMSEGMVLASGDDVPVPVFATGSKPGDRIR